MGHFPFRGISPHVEHLVEGTLRVPLESRMDEFSLSVRMQVWKFNRGFMADGHEDSCFCCYKIFVYEKLRIPMSRVYLNDVHLDTKGGMSQVTLKPFNAKIHLGALFYL